MRRAAAEVVLPLVGVRVPVQLAQPAGLHLDDRRGDRRRRPGSSSSRRCAPARRPPRTGSCASRRWLKVSGTAPAGASTRSASSAGGTGAGEHVALAVDVDRDVRRTRPGDAEVLGQHVARRAPEPVGQQERLVLREARRRRTRAGTRSRSSSPWIECGMPAGKYHRSPPPTSSTNVAALGVDRGDPRAPAIMYAHSASLCQCISRIAAGLEAHVDAGELGRDRAARARSPRAPSRR